MFSPESSTDDESQKDQESFNGDPSIELGIEQLQSSAEQPGPSTAQPTDPDPAEQKDFLGKIIEAVRRTPPDPEKGVSIVKIKKYLKEEFHIRKAEMIKMLKPVVEDAVERNVLIKTTAKRTLLLGSVKLNPAYVSKQDRTIQAVARKADRIVAESDNEETAEPVGAGASRKRKGTEEGNSKSKSKRRLVL